MSQSNIDVKLNMVLICVFCFLGVTYAAKGYFDALVKMGELASESQGSKELGKSSIFNAVNSTKRAQSGKFS